MKIEIIKLKNIVSIAAKEVRVTNSQVTGLEYEFPNIGDMLCTCEFDKIVERSGQWHGFYLFRSINITFFHYLMCIYISSILNSISKSAQSSMIRFYRNDLIDEMLRVLCGEILPIELISAPKEKKVFNRLVSDFTLFLADDDSPVFLSTQERNNLLIFYGKWAGIDCDD